MSKNITFTLLGILLSVGFLGGWFYTQPTVGSGWLLFVAVISAVGLLNHVRSTSSAAVAGVSLTAVYGVVWYLSKAFEYSGWVLFVCIIAALGLLTGIESVVSKSK